MIMLEVNKIYNGDALSVLKTLPNESINCVVTSPPYWALRNYGVEGQLGLESTFQEYISKLCDVFDEVKRILKDDGTCFVNLGDTYSGGGNNQHDTGKHNYNPEVMCCNINKPSMNTELEDKSLCNLPARFSIEMQNRGWILRNKIIWHKPNCMPSSVEDRFTVDFEEIFFFVKNKKYYFEQQKEDAKEESKERYKYEFYQNGKMADKRRHPDGNCNTAGMKNFDGKRNKRTVWSIKTKPYSEAHFATYPEELIEIPIKSGCIKNGIVLDPFFGSGTTGVVAKKQGKNYIGIELNYEYIKIAEKRLKDTDTPLDFDKLNEVSGNSFQD